jgi:hypothetical protein
MEDRGVNRTEERADLLVLIGHAIDGLRLSIDSLDAAHRADGLLHLGQVIREIDGYIEHIDDDPLLRLAPLAPSHIRSGLLKVREDLAVVIRDLDRPTE